MRDERLKELHNAVAEPQASYGGGPVRIKKLKISNYKFFCGDFELDCNANNVLIYGENGSGKSSVYRALEYLTKTKFASIDELTKIACPRCGHIGVDIYSRVTGYIQSIHTWNPAKQQEFLDRHRYTM